MKNANFTKDWITTTFGIILMVLGVLMYLLPMIMEVHKDFTDKWYIPGGVIIIGFLFVRSPDSIVKGADKAIDKGNEKLS